MLKEHNIQVYDRFESMLNEKHKALIVTATGTGKSYLTLEYLNRYNKKALVVVPRLNLGTEWENLSNKFDSVTYHTFVKLNNFDKYDMVVFDEMHHSGAHTWEPRITSFINSTDKLVVGLTADPRRWSDGARDMGEVLFKDTRVDGYSLENAIKSKILPKLTYVVAFWDGGVLNDKYKSKNIPVPLLARFNYALEKRKPIEEILKEHLPTTVRKGIIFVESISAAREAEKWFSSLYPNEKMWVIHSKQSNKLNTQYHEEFKSTKSGYMVAVDMYNEGLHAPGVNTIIMLRRTSSPTIFYQQIGRALHVGDVNDPIIFDFVCNSALLKISSTSRTRKKSDTLYHTVSSISDQTVVHDYTKDILNVIEEIDRTLDQTWSDVELNIIKQYYILEKKDICKRLPDRSWGAIRKKANSLGLYNNNLWTEEELNIIRDYYIEEGNSIVNRLPGRDIQSIKRKANSLGFYENLRWTEKEIEILKQYYLVEGRDILNRLPGRDIQAVRVKANELGITETRQWSDKDIATLVKYYPKEGSLVIKRLSTHRSRGSINNKARELGLVHSSWTEEEITTLVKYYPIEFGKVVSRFPDKSRSQVLSKAAKLGLNVVKNTWTEEEIDILKQYYSIEGMKVKDRLNRSEYAIRTKVSDLGLKRS